MGGSSSGGARPPRRPRDRKPTLKERLEDMINGMSDEMVLGLIAALILLMLMSFGTLIRSALILIGVVAIYFYVLSRKG